MLRHAGSGYPPLANVKNGPPTLCSKVTHPPRPASSARRSPCRNAPARTRCPVRTGAFQNKHTCPRRQPATTRLRAKKPTGSGKSCVSVSHSHASSIIESFPTSPSVSQNTKPSPPMQCRRKRAPGLGGLPRIRFGAGAPSMMIHAHETTAGYCRSTWFEPPNSTSHWAARARARLVCA